MSQTDSVRKAGLDKFYTKPDIAEKCIAAVGLRYNWGWDLVVEPSAGNGSFLSKIPTPKRIGLDISPDHETIQKQDFFTYSPPSTSRNILVIGNPPFGRVSSLAIKFFQHAATFATVIAFIIPRTFRRISVQKKLNPFFHLVHDEDIPMSPCSFEPPMMAKCCFQIWEKRITKRPRIDLPTSHPDWEFLSLGPNDANGQPTPPKGADFALRAYGGKCGDIVTTTTGLQTLRPKSWHWMKSSISKELLIERFQTLDYSCSQNTARQNSIGRGELVRLYEATFQN